MYGAQTSVNQSESMSLAGTENNGPCHPYSTIILVKNTVLQLRSSIYIYISLQRYIIYNIPSEAEV